ncbi:MAG: hypothetical protein RLZZ450_4808 [Pseudomonadota bacterium]|jgi:hypothetical protein
MSPTKATKKPTATSGASERGSSDRTSERKSSPLKDAGSTSVKDAPSVKDAASVKDAPSVAAHNGASQATAVLTPSAPAPLALDEGADGANIKKDRAPSAVQALALELVASNDSQAVLRHAIALEDDREAAANQAARLMQELSDIKPELLVPLIERFARLLISKNKRVVASSASALAPLSRIAPAKVAKQLPLLTQNWEHTTDEGKDGLVRTFAGLCTASVAYQKRLEPALARALGEAEPKLLIRWTEIVLPALKGEPHARARAVVEERLPAIPRPQAQKIADFLGIKLRPLMR